MCVKISVILQQRFPPPHPHSTGSKMQKSIDLQRYSGSLIYQTMDEVNEQNMAKMPCRKSI